MTKKPEPAPPLSDDRVSSDTAPTIDSAPLFADRSEIQIRHNGQIYRLRATKNGKLVMNK